MNASLAIVAAAPLEAIPRSAWTSSRAGQVDPTGSKGMVHASLVAAHRMLDGLICRKINSVSRPSAYDDAGHASPKTEKTLGRCYLVGTAHDAGVGRCRGRVEDLHSRLDHRKEAVSFRAQAVEASEALTLTASMGYIAVCSYAC